MKEALTVLSLAISIISVVLVIAINWNTLRKMRRTELAERAIEKRVRLGKEMQDTEFGKQVIYKLDAISEAQEVYSQSLLHILRTDLLTVTDEIFYINRKRNTKSSKWSNLNERLRRFEVLEEIMDDCYASYVRLGGNHFMKDRYKEAKAIILETQRQSEE